ncbi:cilia- and flagella-associated protein 58 [Chanos chanos]|uniref:Cilia- and flagella-associated protein 58 n=1 Tax=Chanos chanos TaxID=29144 RepID=A0A6J2VPC3_CHACN|nr:cilia- and flagella-associated protein 58 [Chanos chanos]
MHGFTSNQTGSSGERNFELVEAEFLEVLKELSGDKTLEKFRVEYEKLTKALKKSHDNEKRLMTKCRELNAEIVSDSAKLAAAHKLSQDDRTTIATLKLEIDKAWKMVNAAQEQELRAKETIESLKEEITKLSRVTREGAGLSLDPDNNVEELLKAKDELTKARDELLSEVVKLRENLSESLAAQKDVEAQKEKAMESISELEQKIQVFQSENSREARRKEKLEKEVNQLSADLEAKLSDIELLNLQIQRSKEEQQRLELQLREQKIMNERVSKELEQVQVRNTKLQQENEQNSQSLDQLTLENQQRASDLKMKEEEVNQMKQEIAKLTKMREGIQRRLCQTEDQKLEIEQQRETLKNQISGLEREMETSKKQIEMDKKAIDELVRERDILNKNMVKAANATEKQLNIVKLYEQSKKNLEQEIMNYREEAQKQRKIIYQLEKERDRYINEASELTQKVLQHMEDFKVQEMQLFEYKKRIAEGETKLKHQLNLYESLKSDVTLYSKSVVEAHDEIKELNRKIKILTHQNDVLREENGGKEAALVKEQQDFQKVEKEKEALKAELQKMKQQAQETKKFIENQAAEEKKLLKILADSDTERVREKKLLDQVISERDILGTVVVRRNDELALLYEKVKIQQSMLNNGERQYNKRVQDIRLLKMEIKRLHREKRILSKTVSSVKDLRWEVNHLQRELLKERTRYRCLEQQFQNPPNIHHWRKLEARDSSAFELIQKIHSLQRRLVTKTEEVVEKELLLQEKEKLYVELKHILARQPGPETAEQIQIYQQTLREKTKQLKALSAELNMYHSQTHEYKLQIERLSQELQNIKKKYLSQKRKEHRCREKERILAHMDQSVIQPQRPDGPRFTGGGFNLTETNKITT